MSTGLFVSKVTSKSNMLKGICVHIVAECYLLLLDRVKCRSIRLCSAETASCKVNNTM